MEVLILTKNLLAEMSFQSKLQQLNNEVFCSTCLLDDCCLKGQETGTFLSYFDFIILSETISYQEIIEIMPKIRKQVTAIVRKYESDFTKSYEEEQTEYAIDQWIEGSASLEEIRELCQAVNRLKMKYDPDKQLRPIMSGEKYTAVKKQYHFYNFGLSKRENTLLMCLYEYRGNYLSREELCKKIWRDKELVTNSQMSALSTCVHNIKIKVKKCGVKCNPIVTVWGLGYQISDEFCEIIRIET
ncbi:winged helix-turn-helix domain-containing protein [Enterococcus sp. AZ109]|uniref:winged helix-turn-helix domain-containing protein n=1 Tax=Enterococcus sp. AZ109 TaxID=2774634 RepID=UPI003F1F8686